MKNAAVLITSIGVGTGGSPGSASPHAGGPSQHAGSTDSHAGGAESRARGTESHAGGADQRTRDRVTQLLLERGPATAGELGAALGLSPAGIRRHLDAMLADGLVAVRERVQRGPRGRGRPAKVFALTDAGREDLRTVPHTYDGIATAALRWIAEQGGPAGGRRRSPPPRSRSSRSGAGPPCGRRVTSLSPGRRRSRAR